ncbi:ornithine transcarbamylase, mitochondrial-like [Plodia interpunctella]|uniref:ornithine transcarbamylase, mitochondrial-like n=1 Tax=Plodia interpunctella TaxID=58824 RepID=UPI00236785C1|nr:ornithine transcarbamylase, mitochondrial-like [Plodia interpunctella]
MKLLQNFSKCCFARSNLTKHRQGLQTRQCSMECCCPEKPRHLICFKNWTTEMVMNIIRSAMNLKCTMRDTHSKRMDILPNAKVVILQEINEPLLNMAVSKAATLLGAYDVNITDDMVWEHDYNGRVFSYMADAIFVATTTHMCVQRFAQQSSVPVLCMRSRTHASIQALATFMSIIEEYGTMRCVNLAWVGPPHPVLNSYLLLCPMFGANIRFKCCCNVTPVSPLLKKMSEEMCEKSSTVTKQCKEIKEVLQNACIVISGPTPRKEKLDEFRLEVQDIITNTLCNWIYFHTCPRGKEVDDCLFHHCNARTFCAFENMHYIAAALMAYAIKGHHF